MKKFLASCLLFVASAASASELSLGAKAELYGTEYLQKETGKESGYGEVRLLPKLNWVKDKFLLHLEGDLRLDTKGYAKEIFFEQPLERDGNRQFLGIREAYGEYASGKWRLRVGKQVFNWAVTDTVSPSDNLSPRDWKDIIRWDRVGVPAASIRFGTEEFVEWVVVPTFTPSKLPSQDSRWAFALPALPNGGQLLPDSPQTAIRVGVSGFKGFDLGFSFYSGYSYNPFPLVTFFPSGTAQFNFIYRQEEVYALSLARNVFGFNVRAETGFFRQNSQDKFLQAVLGADREFTGTVRDGDNLYVLVQYANEVVTNHSGLRSVDFRRAFSNAFMGKLRYNPVEGGNWSVNFEGSYNFSETDSYFQPSVTWKKNNIEITGGFDILSGPENSFFGHWSGNDRGYILLVMYW